MKESVEICEIDKNYLLETITETLKRYNYISPQSMERFKNEVLEYFSLMYKHKVEAIKIMTMNRYINITFLFLDPSENVVYDIVIKFDGQENKMYELLFNGNSFDNLIERKENK